MRVPSRRLVLRLALAALPLLGLAPALSAPRPAWAQEDDPLAGLSGVAARDLAAELSSDAMQGRKTGLPSARRHEDWVAQQMGDMGLHPKDPAGTYLDPFRFLVTHTHAASLSAAGKELAFGTGFVDLSFSGSGEVEAEVVFVGYGISRPDLGWDDYAGADVKGKVVLALRGAPGARAAQLQQERQIGAKSALAADRGAAGFLVVEGAKPVQGTIQGRFFRAGLPALWVAGAHADAWLAAAPGEGPRTVEAARAALDAGGAVPAPARALGVRVRMATKVEARPDATGHNALGGIDGRDPALRGEVLVVGAHMDHLGVDPLGRVYNGADDNASGAAVVLHLARVLKENRWRPKRTVLFVLFGAEEQGLVGARHLAGGLPFDHDAVVCVLNMDMVGRGKPEVTLAGVKRFAAMGERLLAALPADLRKQVTPEDDVGPWGDHWPFAEKGVPAFFLATRGDHPDYHSVDDDADRLQPECMEAAARVLGALVVRLGEEPGSLKDLR